MNMKDHILAALQEQFETWERLLVGLDEDQVAAPLLSSAWTTRDVVAHLMAWQQRSIARLEAAHSGGEPRFPTWDPQADPEALGDTDATNAWIYEHYRDWTWPQVHQAWQAGFNRFLALGEGVPERDLLATNFYPWLEGYPLYFILVASYDHHQEHWEALVEGLQGEEG
jgi:hypothetical protein